MNSKHVQTFLLVSAAFFSMSAPMRSNSAQTNVTTFRATQVASTTAGAERSASVTRRSNSSGS